MTLETRAKIATFAARSFGAVILLAGLGTLFLATTEPSDRVATFTIGTLSTIFGAAFFWADPISSKDLDSSRDGLSMLAHIMRKRRTKRDSGKR